MIFPARGLKCGVLGIRSKFRGVPPIASRASSHAKAIPASPPPNSPSICLRERSRESHVVIPFVLTSVDIKEFVRAEERVTDRSPNFICVFALSLFARAEGLKDLDFIRLRRPAIGQQESAPQTVIKIGSCLAQDAPGELFGAV